MAGLFEVALINIRHLFDLGPFMKEAWVEFEKVCAVQTVIKKKDACECELQNVPCLPPVCAGIGPNKSCDTGQVEAG